MPRPESFTREVLASCSMHDLELAIHPDSDLDGTFKAFDLVEGDLISVNGWLFIIEDM